MSQAYLIVSDKNRKPIRVLVRDSVVISKEIDGVELLDNNNVLKDNHFRIFKTSRGHRIENTSGDKNIFIDGEYRLEPGEKYDLLTTSSTIIIGKPNNIKKSVPIIFKDPDFVDFDNEEYESSNPLKTRAVDIDKIKKKYGAEKNDSLRLESESLKKRFMAEIPGNMSLKSLSSYFCKFISKHFNLDLILVYRKEKKADGSGLVWKNLAAHNSPNSDIYVPPTSLFDHVRKHGQPHYADLDDENICPSKSVVVRGIRRAGVIPMVYNNMIFGLLYFDSKYNTIDIEDFYKISSLTSHACNHFAVVLERDKVEKISEEVNSSDYAKTCKNIMKPVSRESLTFPGIRCIYSRKSSSILRVAHRQISEDIAEYTVIYGNVPCNNVVIGSIVCAYLDALISLYTSGAFTGEFLENIFYYCSQKVSVPVSLSSVRFKCHTSSKVFQKIKEQCSVDDYSQDDESPSGKMETFLDLKIIDIEEEINKIEKNSKKAPKKINEDAAIISCSGDIYAYFLEAQSGIVDLIKTGGDLVPVSGERMFSDECIIFVTPHQIKTSLIQSKDIERIKEISDNFLLLTRKR